MLSSMETEPRNDNESQLDARALAAAKLEAVTRRRHRLRGRIVAGALTLFAVAWAAVFGQSWVQSQGSGTSQALAQTQALTSSPEESDDDEYYDDDEYDDDEGSTGASPSGYTAPAQSIAPAQSVAPAPVTTSQS